MKKLSTNQKVGKIIKTLRNSKKLTQAQLADELSIHPKRLSNIENGVKPVTITIIDKLSNTFVVPQQYFFDFSEFIVDEDDFTMIKSAIYMLKSTDKETRKKLYKTIQVFTQKALTG